MPEEAGTQAVAAREVVALMAAWKVSWREDCWLVVSQAKYREGSSKRNNRFD